ncbi:MAG: toll/interleukin-1 receptor domain-containing protein [Bryobacteraceae bacterium]
MARVFISYRREDSAAYAGRIFDRLKTRFGPKHVFMDIDSLRPGEDFVEALQQTVKSCDVLIAVIGKQWLTAQDDQRRRRLENPEDFVRLEIATALERGILVIPALVGGAPMPQSHDLPDALKQLARRHAVNVHDAGFHQSMDLLIEATDGAIKEQKPRGRPTQDSKDVERNPVSREQRAASPDHSPFLAQRRWILITVRKFSFHFATHYRQYVYVSSAVMLIGVFVWFVSNALISARQTAANLETGKRLYKAGNYEAAMPFLKRAADAHSPEAERYLGVLAANGEGVKQDFQVARSWYEKAAAAGDPMAMYFLGWLYESGQGVPRDEKKARQSYEKAANAGSSEAMKALGDWYRGYDWGLLFKESPSYLFKRPTCGTEISSLKEDYDQSRKWYEKAALAGNADGMYCLAELYRFGLGTHQNDEQALKWYEKAARAGKTKAFNIVADLYSNKKDDVKAAEWYRKAADSGSKSSMFSLGWMYEKGQGGLPKDDAQAVGWYRKAAAEPYSWRRSFWHKSDADTGAMNNLGVMYENGRGGLPKDDAQAVSWYRKAAEGGSAMGMTNLGSMYENGQGGLPKDDAQAVSWYRKAADIGDTRGMRQLGIMYAEGRGGLAKDEAQAVSWYRKAAEGGNTAAMNNLGWMYENGLGGLAKDEAQAVSWYRKAAQLGNTYAQQALKRLGQ